MVGGFYREGIIFEQVNYNKQTLELALKQEKPPYPGG